MCPAPVSHCHTPPPRLQCWKLGTLEPELIRSPIRSTGMRNEKRRMSASCKGSSNSCLTAPERYSSYFPAISPKYMQKSPTFRVGTALGLRRQMQLKRWPANESHGTLLRTEYPHSYPAGSFSRTRCDATTVTCSLGSMSVG